MEPSFRTIDPELVRLFDANGPFLSLYLRTPADIDNAAQELAVRWQSVRRELFRAGVDEDTLLAVEPLVDGAHERGPGLAVIAGIDGVLLARSLQHEPPTEAAFRYGPLPHAIPLLAEAQRQVTGMVVLTDRTGAEIVTRTPDGAAQTSTVEGEKSPHITRSAPGGWSQRRYQQRAERLWKVNAGEVAGTVTKLVDRVAPRFVAVAGDVRAVQFLTEQLPERSAALVRKIGGEFPDIEPALERADEVARDLAEKDAHATIARFCAERGQRDRAADGPGPTIAALGKAQVDTLLLDPPAIGGRTAWFGEQPAQVAPDRGTLMEMGAISAVEAPLVDVLVRAALGTGACVLLVEHDRANPGGRPPGGPRDGVGALLRWADPDLTSR